MNSQSACQGCYVHPNFLQHQPVPFIQVPIIAVSLGLTDNEKEILQLLAESYNKYLSLNDKLEFDDLDFVRAIHWLQSMIALRVARRIDPKIWRTEPLK